MKMMNFHEDAVVKCLPPSQQSQVGYVKACCFLEAFASVSQTIFFEAHEASPDVEWVPTKPDESTRRPGHLPSFLPGKKAFLSVL